MNAPMIFENHEVEIIEVKGQILFNPRHVAECLELEFKTVQNYMSEMSDKQAVKLTNESISHLTGFRKLHTTGENFLTEAGVYKLVFKSRKPEAEKFTDWVTDTVLPSIRKTGRYDVRVVTNPLDDMPKIASAFDAMKRLAASMGYDENQQLFSANNAVRRVSGIDCMDLIGFTQIEYKPNIQYHTPSVLGDMCGMSAVKINIILREKGLQEEHRDSKNKLVWIVTEKGKQYSRLFDTGKNKLNGTPVQQIKWSEEVIGLI